MKALGYAREYEETSPAIARLFDLTSRVAIVTGGAAGIGRAVALGFARFGADVVIVDVAAEQAERTADEVRGFGRQAQVEATDVTDLAQVEEMVARVQRRFGRIDISFNSAGGGIRKPILELSPEEWQQVVGLNLTGTWNTARAVGAVMVAAGRGKMINVASIYGHVTNVGQSAYAASKGGIVQLTRTLAVEWAPHNVQVNCIAPTYIRTQRTRSILDDPEFSARLNDRSPIHRFGEPWELIGPAVFLASDASGLVTGHSLLADGGWTAL